MTKDEWAEGGNASGDEARAERRREIRRASKILSENAGLLLGCGRHFLEKRGLGGIGLGGGDGRGEIGRGRFRAPAVQWVLRGQIKLTLPVARS
jgi:hypothetical protein